MTHHVPSGWRSTPLASYTPLPMVLLPTCHFGHASHTTGGAFGQLQFSLLLLQHRPTGLSGQGFSAATGAGTRSSGSSRSIRCSRGRFFQVKLPEIRGNLCEMW